MATTESTQRSAVSIEGPGAEAQRGPVRSTTLLDLLFELLPKSEGCERSLVNLAVDAISSGQAVLCGNYKGVPPELFDSRL